MQSYLADAKGGEMEKAVYALAGAIVLASVMVCGVWLFSDTRSVWSAHTTGTPMFIWMTNNRTGDVRYCMFQSEREGNGFKLPARVKCTDG